MQLIALIHRWAGGIIGLLLALLGLTGALLVWKGEWIAVSVGAPADAVTTDPARLAQVTDRILENTGDTPRFITFAGPDVGVHRVGLDKSAGFYADAKGEVLARWNSVWDRPETLAFDIHHHLLMGGTGETLTGIAGLIGIGFVITGLILWWRTRKTFRLRAIPSRMTRPAIIRHHRDLGTLMAPLLFLTMLTGVMMTLRPVAAVLLMPFSSPAEISAATDPPKVAGGPLDRDRLGPMLARAQQRFPQARPRILSLPRKAGDLVSVRMKQPAEWHPNGRTMVWFDGATGALVSATDALALPQGAKLYNLAYPLHAAKVGGLVFKVLQTLAGLALTMLGTFAVWSFWFRREEKRREPRGGVPAAHSLASPS